MFYGELEYWEKRYASIGSNEVFDWYLPYATKDSSGCVVVGLGLRSELLAAVGVPDNRKVLVVGCGLSLLGEGLASDGFADVTCVDFSLAAIEHMRARSGEPPRPSYQVADCSKLTEVFQLSSFDVVVDKGMLDATMCGKDSEVQYDKLMKVTDEIYSVLRPKGLFIHITTTARVDGQKSALFRNPAIPWSEITAVRLEPEIPSNDCAEFLRRPYWLFRLVK